MESLFVLVAVAVLGVPVLMLLMFVTLLRLRTRVTELEAAVDALRVESELREAAAPTLADRVRPAEAASPFPGPATPDLSGRGPGPVPASTATRAPSPTEASSTARPVPPPLPPIDREAAPSPGPRPAPAHAPRPGPATGAWVRPPRTPGPVERAIDAVRRWFTEGNVPVKVGVVVLFAGVAALLKYASDQGLLRLPIELRLAGIALAAVGALVFGWRQRIERRGFGLAMQGGAIGVLMLVLFAACKLYPLLPVTVAFAGTAALVAGLGVLAVRQEALALAVLGVLAGFLAPIWLSTGEGNHVALFSYYAVLNAGIVAIAWRRPWRLLNLLGFAFTFGIGTLWGVLDYRPEDFRSTQPFLVLFFAMYLAVPLLYAAAKGPAQRRIFDGSLVFGTPLVAFALQAGLLRDDRMALAFCALGLAAIYALIAAAVRRREAFAELVAPYAVLAVGFATLAVPLALSARATAAVFALEGAGLLWLGLRQARGLPAMAGIALQLVAALAFLAGVATPSPTTPVINAIFMTAVLIAIAGFATAAAARRHEAPGAAVVAYVWGLAWWLGAGLSEIGRSVAPDAQPDAVLAFLLLTGLVASEVARRILARALSLTAAASLAAPLLLVWWQAWRHGQPLAEWGLLAWLPMPLVAWRVLAQLRDEASPARGFAHAAACASIALLASISLSKLALDAQLGDAWRFAGAALPWLLLAAALALRPEMLAPPFAIDDFDRWRDACASGVALVVTGFFCVGLPLEGMASPLPYVPLANPVELVQLAALLLAVRTLREASLRPLLAGAAFASATAVVLRATHHWGGIDWDLSMFSTGLVQTALTVLWSLIGMLAWVSGSRRQRRGTWQVGAVLMAVVLAKLVLVDRQYLGNLLGIGSFIAFGLLCTAVGYLAPVPPRATEKAA